MADSNIIQNLAIQVSSSATSAANGVEKLASTIEKLGRVLGSINIKSTKNIANALKPLSGIQNIKISANLSKRLIDLGAAAELLQNTDFSGFANLAVALKQLQGLGNVKIPKIVGGTQDVDSAADSVGALEDNVDAYNESATRSGEATSSFVAKLKAIISSNNLVITSLRQLGTALVWPFKIGLGAVSGFIRGVARIAKFRIYRALVKDLAQSFKDLYGYSKDAGTDFAKSMDKINTALVYFRNSIAAMVAPLVDALAPAFDYVVDKIVAALNWLNELFATLSGADTFTVAKKVTQTWDSTFGSTSSSAKNAKDKVDQLKRSLLGFDEINKLDKPNASSTSGSGGNKGSSPYSDNYKKMFEQRTVSAGFKGFSNAIENALSDTLSRIALIVSGATLALGAMFTFSGANVPLGIGLMVAGAAGLAATVLLNWDGLSEDTRKSIGKITAIVGGALLAVGAVLAFSGVSIPLGIGMMVAGAAGLYTAAKLNWDTLYTTVKSWLKSYGGIVGGAFLALGAILALTGVAMPLGIGLMAVGAGTLGISAVLNWDRLYTIVKSWLTSYGGIVGGAFLALGGILALSGVATPLGIGLMAAGAATLGISAVLNWSRLYTTIQSWLKSYGGIVGGAMLALGGILALSGVAMPLGIGLMAAGAVTLGISAVLNWSRLYTTVKSWLQSYGGIVGGAMLALGGILALSGVATPLGIGLMAVGAATLGISAVLNWSRLYTTVKSWLQSYGGIIGSAMLALGGILALSGVAMPLGIGLMAAGAVTLGISAVLNWSRLYTTVKSWLQSYGGIVGGAMLALGGILALSGVATPLGIGLMAAGAATLGISAVLNWSRLYTTIQSWLKSYGGIVGGAMLALGAILALSGVALPLGIGLMALGAVSLVKSAVLNWNTLQAKLRGPIGTITGILSGAKLLLGIIALVGGMIPLGIGLILAGAVGLVSTIAANWNSIVALGKTAVEKVKEGWDKAKKFVVDIVVKIAGKVWDGITKLWDWILSGGGEPTGQAWGDTPEVQIPVGVEVEEDGANKVAKIITTGWDGLPDDVKSLGFEPVVDDSNWQTEWDDFVGHPFEVPVEVDLVKQWESVSSWVFGFLGDVNIDQKVNLAKNAWDTVSKWVSKLKGKTKVSQIVDLIKDWVSVSDWVDERHGNTAIEQNVDLTKAWDTVSNWVDKLRGNTVIDQLIGLAKNWEGTPQRALGLVGLTETVSMGAEAGWPGDILKYLDINDLSTDVSVGVSWLWRLFAGGILAFIGLSNLSTDVSVGVTENWGWNGPLYDLGLNNLSTDVSVGLDEDWGWYGPLYALGLDNLNTDVNVGLNQNWWGSAISALGLDDLYTTIGVGIRVTNKTIQLSSAGGGKWRFEVREKGGIFDNGIWGDIPQYAGGTTNAHGSMFLAGENGPELVGHVGGRTEVLNKSQLAAAMYTAVRSAMTGVTVSARYYDGSYAGRDEEDMEMLAEYVRMGVENAMARQNEYARQSNEYLRQINEKEFTTEITTRQLNDAQRYANRRAGTAVVPVG